MSRFDFRSEDQFKKEIYETTFIENEIMRMWVSSLTDNPNYIRVDEAGADGDFLEDQRVSSAPDFSVKGHGIIEVKFSKRRLHSYFHLKCANIEACKFWQASILLVNGYLDEYPVYTIIDFEHFDKIEQYEIVKWHGFGGKESYKIPVKEMSWSAFNKK